MLLSPTKIIMKLAALLSLPPMVIALTCTNSDSVYSACCGGCGYSFSTSDELRQVVDYFRLNSIAAEYEYGKMNCWDVSKITDMSWLFTYREAYYGSDDFFNEPIECWNVNRVSNMESMFSGASSFNQPLNSWDVSGVTNMFAMFRRASSFNQPLNSWDVSGVTNMAGMFELSTSFNQPIDSWDVSRLTNMSYMFNDAKSFNQPLEDWDVSSVLDMKYLLQNASNFNQPLNSWDVSSVADMMYMFDSAVKFDQPLNNWVTSKVTTTQGMFEFAESFNQPLNSWDVSSVTDMKWMFEGASSFNQPLDNWDVSSVTDMSAMFYSASSFGQDLCEWYNTFEQSTPDVYSMFLFSNCASTSDPDFDSKSSFCGTAEYPTCAGREYPEPTIAPAQIKPTSNNGNMHTTESSSSWFMAVIGAVCAVVVLTAVGLIAWCVIKRRRMTTGQREPASQSCESPTDPAKGTVVPAIGPAAEEQPVAEPPLSEPYFQEVPEAQVVYVLPAPVVSSAPDYYSKYNIGP